MLIACWKSARPVVSPFSFKIACFLALAAALTAGALASGSTLAEKPEPSGAAVSAAAQQQGSLALSATVINFGSVLDGTITQVQTIEVQNNGAVPVTLQSLIISGDFAIPASNCQLYEGASGFSGGVTLTPQEVCWIDVVMSPTKNGTETGQILITDTSLSGSHSVALTGLGIAQSQTLSFSPQTITFASQPLLVESGVQTFTVYNTGNEPVTIDSAVATGDFEVEGPGSSIYSNCVGIVLSPPNSSPYSYPNGSSCRLDIAFTPTATGLRTGVLTITDTATGSTQRFSLAGQGIPATGSLVTGSPTLIFPAQAQGSTSQPEEIDVFNPGNSPVQLNSISIVGDFAADMAVGTCGPALPFTIAPMAHCSLYAVFSPTQASGNEGGSLAMHSSAGTNLVYMEGPAVAATGGFRVNPLTYDFGPWTITPPFFFNHPVEIENTGQEPIAFTGDPVVTPGEGTPADDFKIFGKACALYTTASPLPPHASCIDEVFFGPTITGKESATLTLPTNVGIVTVALTGQGEQTAPPIEMLPTTESFETQMLGTSSPANAYAVGVTNMNGTPVTLASAKITSGGSDYSIPPGGDKCSGTTLSSLYNECGVILNFTPTAANYRTGVLTVTDTSGNTYTASLTGYGEVEIDNAGISSNKLAFNQFALDSPTPTPLIITLMNHGNVPFTVGAVQGTNVSASGGARQDFTIGRWCTTVAPNAVCKFTVAFTPSTTGSKTGSLSVNITYPDNKTASYTVSLTGTATGPTDSVQFLPASLTFPSVLEGAAAAVQPQYQSLVLTNRANGAIALGAIAGTNFTFAQTGATDFLLSSSYDFALTQCSPQMRLAPGASCAVAVTFQPQASGARTGTVSIPITYSDLGRTTVTATLSGTGLAPTRIVQISPGSGQFNAEVAGTSDPQNTVAFMLTNTGNSAVAVAQASLSNSNFTVQYDQCSNSTLQPTNTCRVYVAFSPLATATATLSGILTIPSNATGGTHTAGFTGFVVPANQPLALSQTAVGFGNQTAGTAGQPVAVYLSNRSPASVSTGINSIALTGANPADFQLTQNCGTALAGRQSCVINVAFAPQSGASGSRTAMVVITTAAGQTLAINVAGSAR